MHPSSTASFQWRLIDSALAQICSRNVTYQKFLCSAKIAAAAIIEMGSGVEENDPATPSTAYFREQ
jgi:hypothetical protein